MGPPPYVAPTANMTAMSGEMTGVEGQPPVEKATKVWLPWVAFADDGADKGIPPPTDDPMGTTIDQATAQNAAGSMPEASQGAPDRMASVEVQDDGVSKVEEDGQSGGAAV